MIKCDICGYQLEIDQDGMAHCRHCGMNYTIESVKKKYQDNNNKKEANANYVRLKITEVQSSIFSKIPAFIAEVLEGELKARDYLCLEGTKNPFYKVEWAHEYLNSENSVRFRLEGASKKTFKVGQVLVTSYAKEAYFKQMLMKNFKSYQIDENVPIDENFYPISYMLLENKQPKVAILLCNSRSYNTKAIQSTMKMCEDANIPVLRFYKDFRNDEDYVCNRIKSVL